MKRQVFSVLVVFAAGLAAAVWAGPGGAQGPQERFDAQAEIAAAQSALTFLEMSRGGMGGLGVMPEPDLAAINDMIGESERLLREAKRYAGDIKSVHDLAWCVGYARAARELALAATELGRELGHFPG